MTHFEVWAPTAKRVELALNGRRLPMVSIAGGRWVYDADTPCEDGSRYGFSIDGGPVRPDPRSPFQPEGVHGLSATVDHHRFHWHDEGWRGFYFPGSVLYELHVGTFTSAGTFEAAIERLPHLVELGVDAIELLPVAEFSGNRGWGYDGVHLYAPHHAYGGPSGLKRLVDACHRHGLGVIIDVVYNHLGPVGNYLAEYGPYFSKRHHTHWGEAINFDGQQAGEVRKWAIDNGLMWLREYRCDGLRLDAVHAIVDQSATHLLQEMAADVAALAAAEGRPLWLVAESDLNDPRFVRPAECGGFGLQAAWADDFHHAVHALLSGERSGYYADYGAVAQLAKALRQAWVFDGNWSSHRQRYHGAATGGLTADRFVVSIQNHDQVGNRAQGDRLSHLVSLGRQKMAAAWLLTAPFVPLLFQGEEWGASTPFLYFTDHEDPQLGEAVRQGRRREFTAFGWAPEEIPDPQSAETFARSRLNWEELDKDVHAELLTFYRALIALRRREAELTDPRFSRAQVHFDQEAGWVVLRRGAIAVLSNLGNTEVQCQLGASAQVLLASTPDVVLSAQAIRLPADTTVIVRAPNLTPSLTAKEDEPS